MTSLELIKKLCDKNKTSISGLEKVLGYGNGSLSKAKVIPSDRIYEIALYFGVRMEDLMPRNNTNDTIRSCPDCGVTYDCSDDEAIDYHNEEHFLWKMASEKFGELHCDYYINELIKAKNRNIRDNMNNSLNVRYKAELEVLRCLFSRSVAYNRYNLEHCTFDEYVAMMMHGKHYRKNLDKELYQAIVNDFGTMPGIEDGKSIYIVPTKVVKTIAAHKDDGDFSPEELKKIEEYKKLLIAARPKE